ncbi:ferredoxin [Streptomyces lavendulae]|uniref:ferredoxin n=1 Tax=Streptomyces lavendulae TaxID=1914 RepID=UPI0033D90B14
MGEIDVYWDPLPTVRMSAGELFASGDPSASDFRMPMPREYLLGKWEERNWRNVPGPFYGALTDNCWTGRLVAPAHILYDDEQHGMEFVYRQPRNEADTYKVLYAAVNDPYAGYACDGDDHWTPESVRSWWADRRRLVEWIDRAATRWLASERPDEREIVEGLTAYRQYVEGELETHLKGYIFWLDQRRNPLAGEDLPGLV